MADGASLVDLPLHANIRLVAQRCRGPLCQADQAAARSRRVQVRGRAKTGDREIPRREQPRPTPIQMDEKTKRNSGSRKKRAPSVRFYPLDYGTRRRIN